MNKATILLALLTVAAFVGKAGTLGFFDGH